MTCILVKFNNLIWGDSIEDLFYFQLHNSFKYHSNVRNMPLKGNLTKILFASIEW